MTEIISRVAPSHHESLSQLMKQTGGMETNTESNRSCGKGTVHVHFQSFHHMKGRPVPPLPPPPPAILHRMSIILGRGVNPTMGELSKALSLPLSTTTRIVNMGESCKFLQRQPDAEDGRIVRVALTQEGRRFHKTIMDIQTQDAAKVLGCLTPEERAILLTLLRKVASSIEKE